MQATPSTPLRKINSYAVRNRTLHGQKAKLYQAGYKIFGLTPVQDIGMWDYPKIFNNNNPVIIEIGFGNGATLLNNAASNPEVNYIGIEVFQTGILNILAALQDSDNTIANLRVCQADARVILAECIPAQSLAGVQIFFPDPWPKTRHHKRRLIQTDFISLLAAKIQTGGFIHLATDWANYADHMKMVLDNHPLVKKLDIENNTRVVTKYERRGLKFGHEICDLKYLVN